MIKYVNKNLIMYVSIFLFIIISLIKVFHHIPWADEAHAWNLAKLMNGSSWLSILRDEGHPILWYLFIMPFAKLNIAYPYSMLFINWLFGLGCILLIWLKSPFNLFVKVFLTASPLFLKYFSIVARDYTLGIFGCFLLCAYFKDKLKYPIIYSMIIAFVEHTHLVNLIGIIPIIVLFFYELIKTSIKNKDYKKMFFPIIIFVISSLFWLYCFWGAHINSNMLSSHKPIGYECIFSVVQFNSVPNTIFSLALFLLVIFLIFYNIGSFLYIVTVNSCIIAFCCLIYRMDTHSLIYIYVYVLIAYWLIQPHFKNNILKFLFYLSFVLVYINPLKCIDYTLSTSFDSVLMNKLKNADWIKDIYVTDFNFSIYVPYLDVNTYWLNKPDIFDADKYTNKSNSILYTINEIQGKQYYYSNESEYLYIVSDIIDE